MSYPHVNTKAKVWLVDLTAQTQQSQCLDSNVQTCNTSLETLDSHDSILADYFKIKPLKQDTPERIKQLSSLISSCLLDPFN